MSGSPSFAAVRIDHVAVIVTDVDRARRFYTDVLRLREVPRPESFDFPGAWFQVGPDAAGPDAAGQVIHLLGHPEADPRGRRHFCLWVQDVHADAGHVERCGGPVLWDRKYKIRGIDRFFTADPDGNRIEVQGPERRGGGAVA